MSYSEQCRQITVDTVRRERRGAAEGLRFAAVEVADMNFDGLDSSAIGSLFADLLRNLAGAIERGEHVKGDDELVGVFV